MSEQHPSDTPKRGFRRQLIKGLGLVAILILLMMWLAGVFKSKVQPGKPELAGRPAEEVQLFKAERVTYPLLIDQVGTVRSRTEAQVSARIMAQVKDVRVREGEHVCGTGSKDCTPTVMLVLDNRDIRAKLRQAAAQITALEEAQQAARANLERELSDFKRTEDLEKHQAATGQQLEHARARKDVAQAEIGRIAAQKEQAEASAAEARVMLSYTEIQAPFSGTVIRKTVDVGDMASPGQPLFVIEIAAQPEVQAIVSESLLPSLKTGQQLPVVVDSIGQTFTGTVREIVPSADPSTRTVQVKVSLPPDPALVNGLFARIGVLRGSYSTIQIPAGAVIETGQLYVVQVVEQGYLHRRYVTLGERHGAMIEVLSGIGEGEEVAVSWKGKKAAPTTG